MSSEALKPDAHLSLVLGPLSCAAMRPLLILLAAAALPAADAIPPLSTTPGLLSGDHLLGDLDGLRSGFSQHGLKLDVWAMGDGSYHSRDPGDGKRAYGNYLVEAGIEMDTGAFLGVPPGGTIHVAWQRFDGEAGSAALGTLQPASWLDAGTRTQLARVWYEQSLFGDALLIKVGKEDASYDFAVNAFGLHFLNASPRVEPTIVGMPTHPDPASGARVARVLDAWDALPEKTKDFIAKSDQVKSGKVILPRRKLKEERAPF